jgi:hypothetical protein
MGMVALRVWSAGAWSETEPSNVSKDAAGPMLALYDLQADSKILNIKFFH